MLFVVVAGIVAVTTAFGYGFYRVVIERLMLCY